MKARRVFLLILVLVAAIAAAYSNSFEGKFVLDDAGSIVGNVRIRDLSSVTRILSVRYIVDVTFAIDYMIGGLNPAYYHFTNLVIHLVCSVLLFMLVRVLVRSAGASSRNAEWQAFFVALLWGVHPLTTSAVTYVCQRYESLMSLFYLAALLSCAAAMKRSGAGRRAFLALSVLVCGLGMLCKQVMITAPVMILAMDAVFLSGGWRKAISGKPWYYAALAVCMLSLTALMVAFPEQHAAMFSTFSAKHGRWLYLVSQGQVILHYLKLAVWPYPLSIDYAWLPDITRVGTWISFATVGFLFLLVVWGFAKYPKRFFAGLGVFVLLSPSSSIIPLPDLAFEHRMYLPLAGVIASIVSAVNWSFKREWIRVAAGLAVAAVILLGAVTYRRNIDYHSPEKMWSELTVRIPHNLRAYASLAVEQFKRGAYVETELTAREMLKIAEELTTDQAGMYDIPSSSPSMYEALGKSLLGQALMGQGRYSEALNVLHELVLDYPGDIAFLQNRALALLALGRRIEGESDIDEVLKRNPDLIEALMVKADLLRESGQHDQALSLLDHVMTIYPGFVPARIETAWLLSVSYIDSVRDGVKAAAILDGLDDDMNIRSVRVYEVRAAVMAELGKYDAAVELQLMAVEDARLHYADQDSRTLEAEGRLALYRLGKPYRLSVQSKAVR